MSLNDQKIVTLIPTNCRQNGKVQIVQAVIRQESKFTGRPPGDLVYRFVPAVLDELESKAPMQLSFLLVHEWLWDVSKNVDRNRRINRFLHSEALEHLSAEAVQAQLAGLGLTAGSRNPEPENYVPPEFISHLKIRFQGGPELALSQVLVSEAKLVTIPFSAKIHFQQPGADWRMNLIPHAFPNYSYDLTFAITDPGVDEKFRGEYSARGNRGLKVYHLNLNDGGIIEAIFDKLPLQSASGASATVSGPFPSSFFRLI